MPELRPIMHSILAYTGDGKVGNGPRCAPGDLAFTCATVAKYAHRAPMDNHLFVKKKLCMGRGASAYVHNHKSHGDECFGTGAMKEPKCNTPYMEAVCPKARRVEIWSK